MRVAAAIAVLLASTQASASPHRGVDQPGRVRVLEAATPRAAATAFAPLAQRGWQGHWDRDTGVPAWIIGSFVDAPGATADATRAELAARAFVASHLDVLAPGATLGDLVLVSNQLDGDIRTVAFAQRWRGRRVVGGQLGVVIAHDRLFAASSAAWPRVVADSPGRAQPATQRGRAQSWILAETGVRAVARPTGERVVLPLMRRAGAIEYRLADVLDVTASTGPERWDVYVAPDGTPLGRTSKVMAASATLQYNAGVRHAASIRADQAAPHASITVNAGAATTAVNGAFTWSGTSPSTVVPGLVGTYVRIINQAGGLATDSLVGQPGGTVVWNRATDELADAQLSSYVWVSQAKARARLINPGVASWLDMALDVYVNEAGSCNAYSTGNDLHLHRASSTCQNTGRVADVVFHEFGHSLHNQSVIVGMGAFESHLSEGLSDFFAANITGDPAVGRGFFYTDEPLRHLDPIGSERVYPVDFDFDPHISGLIIAGALWDLRKTLIEDLGLTAGVTRTEKIFTGVMQRANDIGTSFDAALIADDDDANLGNGTPNFCALERTFGAHGLVTDYAATTVAPPVVEGHTLRMSVSTPEGTTCTPAVVTNMTVIWRANDGVASELALVAQDATLWAGTFPEQVPGTVISYSIDVQFDDGSIRSFPNNAADPRYQLFIGPATEIWCERLDADPMWEQTSNLSFEWQWAAVEADIGTLDPDAAISGTHVLGTDIDGDSTYRANLISSISTPTIDVSSYETVRLQYWRWLTVEDALFDKASITAGTTEIWRNASAQNGTLDHVDREWRFHDVDLTPYVNEGSIAVRWGLSSDFGKELGGWTLDDICIVGLVKVPRCGDGELDAFEQCDDGNTDSDDGCTATCIDEVTAGGGGCCSASREARGTWLLVLAVALALAAQRRRRSSSLVPSRSVSLRIP